MDELMASFLKEASEEADIALTTDRMMDVPGVKECIQTLADDMTKAKMDVTKEMYSEEHNRLSFRLQDEWREKKTKEVLGPIIAEGIEDLTELLRASKLI